MVATGTVHTRSGAQEGKEKGRPQLSRSMEQQNCNPSEPTDMQILKTLLDGMG